MRINKLLLEHKNIDKKIQEVQDFRLHFSPVMSDDEDNDH